VTDPRLLLAEASEVVDAARRLWDSWEDDAIIADESTGRFLDADRVHYTDFRGELLSVKGPALVPRPPQGQVVVFAPEGVLRPGLADVALVSGATEALLRAAAAVRTAPRVVAEIEVALVPGSAVLDAHWPWPRGDRLRHTGSAAGLVALLARLDGIVDGVRLIPAALDADLAVLGREVLPALPPAPGVTLRDRFRLARPANRYATR
jgi:alkanesulfonate monooxygenase SsuD/methylene tetrahydromethanopterin reductase-like flavin-dependent oxidoreductase (luciferase family)